MPENIVITSYLEKSSKIISGESGTIPRVILSDGYPIRVNGWEVHIFKRMGIRAQMWRAFSWADDLGLDQVLIAEDDIIPCKNFVKYISTLKIDDSVAFLDFHDMTGCPDEKDPGIYFVDAKEKEYNGNQLTLYPKRTYKWLLQQDPFSILKEATNRDGVLNAADVTIGKLISKSPWPRWSVHKPALALHVGHHSAVIPGRPLIGVRTTQDFPGEDFDCLELTSPQSN